MMNVPLLFETPCTCRHTTLLPIQWYICCYCIAGKEDCIVGNTLVFPSMFDTAATTIQGVSHKSGQFVFRRNVRRILL